MAGGAGDHTQTLNPWRRRPHSARSPHSPPLPVLHTGDDGGVAQPGPSAPPRRCAARVRGLALHALLLRGPARRPRPRGSQGHDGGRPDVTRVGRHLHRPVLPGPRHAQVLRGEWSDSDASDCPEFQRNIVRQLEMSPFLPSLAVSWADAYINLLLWVAKCSGAACFHAFSVLTWLELTHYDL